MAKIVRTDDADFAPDTHGSKPLHQYGGHRRGGGVDADDVLHSLPDDCEVAVVKPDAVEFYSTSRPYEVKGSTPVVKASGGAGKK